MMAIVKVTDATVIEEGKWLCFEPVITDLACGHPRKVQKVSGQRVYIERRDIDGYTSKPKDYRMRHTAVFMCDTQEEGMKLVALSWKQRNALDDAVSNAKRAVRNQYKPYWENLYTAEEKV